MLTTVKSTRKHGIFDRRPSTKSWPLLMSLALSCTPAWAETKSAPSSPTLPQPSHINVNEIKSSKGITAWLVESHEIPVISVALAFKRAGTAADPEGLAGLATLLSSMLDEGAGTWDSQEFKKFLLEKNIEPSILVSQDTFQISFRTVKENIGEAFRVLKVILTEPRFDKQAMDRVKNQIKTILEQSLHSEHFIAEQKLHALIYGKHPYGKTAEQRLKDLPKITPDHLRKFMKDRLGRDQLLISVVGDITAEDLKVFLDNAFGELPEKATPSIVKDAVLLNLSTTVIEPLDIPQSTIFFVQPGICRNNPQFYAAFVLMKILGDGMFESRLWNEIREKRGLAYGVDADLNWSEHAALIVGGTATKNKSVKEAISLIRQVWEDMYKGATQTELDFVKKRLIGSFSLNFSSTAKIAKALLIYQIDQLGIDYINKRNSFINALTLEDINKAAKAFLKPELLTFVIVGKPDEMPAQKEKSETGVPKK